MRYNYYFKIVLISILSLLAFPLIAQQRMRTPDGETVRAQAFIKLDNVQIRVFATPLTMYYSIKKNDSTWSDNMPLYMVAPISGAISQMSFTIGDEGQIKTLCVVLDNGILLIFHFDNITFSFDPNPEIVPPPPGRIYGVKAILSSSAWYLLTNWKLFINYKDGKPWVQADTSIMFGSYINDICFDTASNVLIATPNGLLSLNGISNKLSRIKNIDSTFGCFTVFATRNGYYYTGTTTQGILTSLSTDQGTTWTQLNDGTNNPTFIQKFGEDDFGNVYAIGNNSTYDSYHTGNYYALRLSSGATTWTHIDTSLFNLMGTIGQFYDISGDSVIFAANAYGSYKSSDGCNTWESNNNNIQSEQIYGIQFLESNKTVVSTTLGIFNKDSASAPWIKRYPPVGFTSGKTMQRDSSGKIYTTVPYPNFYAFHAPDIIASDDAGTTWQYDTLGVSGLAYNQSYNSSYFVDKKGNQHYIYVDHNNGANANFIYVKYPGKPWGWDTVGLGFMKYMDYDVFYLTNLGSDGKASIYSSWEWFHFTDPAYYSQPNLLFKHPINGGQRRTSQSVNF